MDRQGCELDGSEREELDSLISLFSDVDRSVVEHVYLKQCDRDFKDAQQHLAELARDPAALQKLQMLVASAGAGGLALLTSQPSSQGARQQAVDASPTLERFSPRSVANPVNESGEDSGASHLAALGIPSAPEEPAASTSYMPALPGFDLAEIATSLTTGITHLASNITGWVADLASAFDSGWHVDDSDGQVEQAHSKDAPSVGIGGSMGIDRPYQRRHVQSGGGGGLAAARSMSLEEPQEGEELSGPCSPTGASDGKDD